MGRKPGSVNADHEEKRAALARAALEAWTEEGAGMSMRALARACDTSIPTLYNYFDDRDGLFEAPLVPARSNGVGKFPEDGIRVDDRAQLVFGRVEIADDGEVSADDSTDGIRRGHIQVHMHNYSCEYG